MKEKSFEETHAINNIPKNTNRVLGYFSSKGLNNKEIEIIDNFLNDKKLDLKKYDKLAIKFSKKRENSKDIEKRFTDQLVTSLLQNYDKYNISFYENLKKLLFDFCPKETISIYIDIMGPLYRKEETRQKVLEEYNIPIKAYLLYLTSSYNTSYESIYSYTDYKEYLDILKKEIKENFSVLLEIMDIITVKAQIKLIDLLMEKESKKTINYILTNLINKATAKKIAQRIIEILEDKIELKDKIIELLKSKKKPAREIAVELLIKWKLPENKKLLTPLINDKSQNIVNMIANFLAST